MTHHYPGPVPEPSRSEARRRHLFLIESLGIWLPGQHTAADLRLRWTGDACVALDGHRLTARGQHDPLVAAIVGL